MLSLIRHRLVRNISPVVILRQFSTCRPLLLAHSADSDVEFIHIPKPHIPEYNRNANKRHKNAIKRVLDNEYAYNSLETIDMEERIFDKSVTKVVDTGYVPGNWMRYTLERLSELHGVDEEKLYKKCYVLGVDLLFQTPPNGVSTIQGNIFSKLTHKSVITQLRQWTELNKQQKRKKDNDEEIDPKSYITKEQEELKLEHEITGIENKLENLSLDEYRADVVLSDLARPFMQSTGYYNNSMNTPYLRTYQNEPLKQVLTKPDKACIDLADAALMLACRALRPGGTLVLRLETVRTGDPETDLLRRRLDMVFNHVHIRRTDNSRGFSRDGDHELYYICRNKRKDGEYDIRTIFNLE
ncbi:uncharacterized protein SPAPADRAFT_157554 [Spathaspora passalidarum NRRL Y-27907]|uniref:rRNA methyltransferase 2, mitochondrial n=1 Tax=Spathaspora passalidarum (strain NRRL Y-27907 / 11-Y1) TaxID=619300 RepID=G3AU97_SPAPN|nr:uncharacterized protein SPAPADRAFT_157554 [Spathaspora passalidarum NRRL Y-27907]EGW30473.1 hypothetical protein SPAPADRAFT_157554 [Spathaspora passalidarum NRRL Y-27907]